MGFKRAAVLVHGDRDEIRLGDRFVIDPRRGHLLSGDERVAIGARAFELLCALAERAGELISKQSLIDRVWPDVIVEENNLQVQVWSLRKVLGTGAIATVPGRGYRLCMSVAGSTQSPAGTALSEPGVAGGATHQSTQLVGRRHDVAEVANLLQSHRLVTLVGAGGVGKTSVARALARRWASDSDEGVAWIDLAPLSDGALVVTTLAAALHLDPAASAGPIAAIANSLADRSLLVVLDNAEHLIDSVAALAGTLAGDMGQSRMLVTTRQPLLVASEVVHRLEGLAITTADTDAFVVPHDGAVALFAMRAYAVHTRFAVTESNVGAIEDICRRLDGLPLAIEMAAARVPSLGVSGVKAQLEAHWQLLSARGRRVSPRHRDLQATLDWSYGLLTLAEQRLLKRLAVFSGGFTLAAARALGTEADGEPWKVDDTLATLIDKSMVAVDCHDPPRYQLLETVRAYAREALAASGELDDVRARHASWCLQLFQAADDAWWTSPTPAWIADMLPEMDNLRGALAWSFGRADDGPRAGSLAVLLVAAALPMWERLGQDSSAEARMHADRALSLITANTDAAVQVRLHSMRGNYYACVDAGAAVKSSLRAIEILDPSVADRERCHALIIHARAQGRVGEFDAAHHALSEAEAPCSRAGLHKLWGLLDLTWGFVLGMERQRQLARPHLERALAIFDQEQAGNLAPMARNDLADCVWSDGDLDYAATLLREAIAHAHSAPPALADLSGLPELNLAGVLAEQGKLAEAMHWARLAQPLLRRSERTQYAFDTLSLMAMRRGAWQHAAVLQAVSDARYAAVGISAREPNEMRLHALVEAGLKKALSPIELRAAQVRAGSCSDDAAWRLALGE